MGRRTILILCDHLCCPSLEAEPSSPQAERQTAHCKQRCRQSPPEGIWPAAARPAPSRSYRPAVGVRIISADMQAAAHAFRNFDLHPDRTGETRDGAAVLVEQLQVEPRQYEASGSLPGRLYTALLVRDTSLSPSFSETMIKRSPMCQRREFLAPKRRDFFDV